MSGIVRPILYMHVSLAERRPTGLRAIESIFQFGGMKYDYPD